MRSRRLLLIALLVVAASAVGTALLSRIRPIDGDEGYYAAAAALVARGETPYADFFYPQMPYFPYIYAPFERLVGHSLADLRLLSVALGVAALGLWAGLLWSRLRTRPMFVLGGLLLVALNPDLASWGVTVKTYALANLAVFATLLALDRGLAGGRLAWYLAAGLAAGLAVGVRLLYLPWAVSLLAVLVWLRWRRPGSRVSPAAVLAFAVGLVLALLPAFRLYLADPARFRFNNLDYHQLRFSPLERAGAGAGDRALAALGELGRALLGDPSLLLLIILAVAGALAARRAAREKTDGGFGPVARIAGAGAVVHTVACLLPDPVHAQYFTSPLVPMLAPLAVLGLIELARSFGRPATLVGALVGLAAVLCFLGLQVRQTGMSRDEVWSFDHLAAVTANIESRTEPGDLVLAFWSGYVFESGRRFVPGMENHFALGVSERLPLDRKVEYHIAGKELLLKAILTKAPKVVVLGAWMHEVNTTLEQKDLPLILKELDANYEIAWYRGETKILVRRPGPGLKI